MRLFGLLMRGPKCDLSILALVSSHFMIVGCQTREAPISTQPIKSIKILETTLLPGTFIQRLSSKDAVMVPGSILNISRVSRPRAEMRSGPGVHFQLVDSILAKNQKLLAFERIGVWEKVMTLDGRTKGWVHHRTIARAQDISDVVIPGHQLPTVIALKPVKTVFTFPEREERPVHIPKGAIFRSFQKTNFGSLVWLEETNSVMWMSGEDVQ